MHEAKVESAPEISVVIPVHDGGAPFLECLRSISASSWRDFEVIVVDDGSTESIGRAAASFPCRLVALPVNLGPANARNVGARQARGRLLFFLDADILVRRDTLEKIVRAFSDEPQIDALFGSYAKDTEPRNFVSRYKNLLHHYTHQNSDPDAVTFCGGFGAIRREVFLQMGGFDPSWRFLEDIEFGRCHRVLRASVSRSR
jgi:glycosyltransferase involved in cell wall biosynthesis